MQTQWFCIYFDVVSAKSETELMFNIESLCFDDLIVQKLVHNRSVLNE